LKLLSVVGARPNFIKIAPFIKAVKKHQSDNLTPNIEHLLVHTGQHYDSKMSDVFFQHLGIPEPDYNLDIGSGSHAYQTGQTMIEFEKVLLKENPDLVIVVGDVNSTIACSLTAVKLGIKIAHIEAGLRSFDRSMPEEINRVLTDAISDFLFVTEKSGMDNLIREGVSSEKIFFVGNLMIDSLIRSLPLIDESKILSNLKINPKEYIVLTLHRPSNVDDYEKLKQIVDLINVISEKKKVIFPIHPRTSKNLEQFNLYNELNNSNAHFVEPLGYLDFIKLVKESFIVLTDSGGIQEETTFLGVPCITLRNTTERPVTVEIGTNYLVGEDISKVYDYIKLIFEGKNKIGSIPELWDGNSANRVLNILINNL